MKILGEVLVNLKQFYLTLAEWKDIKEEVDEIQIAFIFPEQGEVPVALMRFWAFKFYSFF